MALLLLWRVEGAARAAGSRAAVKRFPVTARASTLAAMPALAALPGCTLLRLAPLRTYCGVCIATKTYSVSMFS